MRKVILFFILLISIVAWSTYNNQNSKDVLENNTRQNALNYLQKNSLNCDALLKRLGIDFTFSQVKIKDDELRVDYNLICREKDKIKLITKSKGKERLIWLDINNNRGLLFEVAESIHDFSNNTFKGNLKIDLMDKNMKSLDLSTGPFYAYLKPLPDFKFTYFYGGGDATIEVNKKFIYEDLEFHIDSLKLTENEFKVFYHQVSAPYEKGIYLLDFSFEDDLGNEYYQTKEPELEVIDPKEFRIKAHNSLGENWTLRLKNVICVIPSKNKTIVVD